MPSKGTGLEMGGGLGKMEEGIFFIDDQIGVGTWSGRNKCIMSNYVNHGLQMK